MLADNIRNFAPLTVRREVCKAKQSDPMGVFTDHPHTAVTERINNIVSYDDLTLEIEIPELLGLIKLQYYGPTEAARAMRKKLKYGDLIEKHRSLELLNLVIVNGGKDLTELYNDRKLLEQLRAMANDTTVDLELRKKLIGYAISWNEEFDAQRYYLGVASLKKQLPKAKRVKRRNYFMDDEGALSDEENDTPAGSSSYAQTSAQRARHINPNDKYKIPKINLKKEGPKIRAIIAEASTCSTDLTNALQMLNRARGELSGDSPRCTQLFEKSRIVRRRVLRYLQLIESEEYLGSLIHANEQLVKSLQLYTEYASYPGQDSSEEYSTLSESDESETNSLTESLASQMIEQHAKSKFTSQHDPFSDLNRVDSNASLA